MQGGVGRGSSKLPFTRLGRDISSKPLSEETRSENDRQDRYVGCVLKCHVPVLSKEHDILNGTEARHYQITRSNRRWRSAPPHEIADQENICRKHDSHPLGQEHLSGQVWVAYWRPGCGHVKPLKEAHERPNGQNDMNDDGHDRANRLVWIPDRVRRVAASSGMTIKRRCDVALQVMDVA